MREDVEVLDVVTPSELLGRLLKCILHVLRIGEPLGFKTEDGGSHYGELEGMLDDGDPGCLEGRGDAEGTRLQVEERG